MAAEKWVQSDKKDIMAIAWILCGAGILFSATGVYLFYQNVYEKNKKILRPVLLMVAGVILISVGTAKYFKLI